MQYEYAQLLERSEATHRRYCVLLTFAMIMANTIMCFKYTVDICTLY